MAANKLVQAIDDNDKVVTGALRPTRTGELIASGTAGTLSLNYGDVIRLHVEANSNITFFASPGTTPTTSDLFMSANNPELFRVNAGDIISVSGGTAHIVLME